MIRDAEVRFKGAFAEKLFLEQLMYYADLTEDAIQWVENPVSNLEIKTTLSEFVKEYYLR